MEPLQRHSLHSGRRHLHHLLSKSEQHHQNLSNIIKIDRNGNLLWDLEGDSGGDFTGVSWSRQHGHHLLDNGDLLIFNNGGGSGGFFGGEASLALEFALNGTTASQAWSYDGNESSSTLGDVQRLSNGNTLVTYSNAGVIHEVDPSGNLVRSIAQSGNRAGTGGYSDWRPDLYGAPYRY